MRMRNKDIKKALDGYFAVLSSYQPVYSTYAGGIYEMELTRAAIHCFATHCSKLKPEVIGSAAPSLGRILQFKPNPLMDTKKYLYRLATAYMTDNNALIAPLLEFDEVKGFYPLAVGKVQLMEHDGQTFVRYDMGGGEYFAVELSRCGILNQFQYTSELWGESNLCLRPTLELMDAQTQGILNGIKNSAVIRFIAKLANSLRPKDVKEEQERLKEINLGINNTAGVFVIDQKYEDVKQIDSKPYIINPSQMEYIKQNVFTYFGVNEHILQNCFTPDEWNAYYEGKIEPFALEIGLVHTNMTFTERERAFGNQIFFSTNRLQYASIQDKINYVVQMGDRGRTSINEDREVFNLPPVEGGDRHFIRGEYRPVDSYDGMELSADTAESQPLPPVDKSVGGGIMEERDYIQNPDTGKMEGSTGGGSSGGSDSGGQGESSDSSASGEALSESDKRARHLYDKMTKEERAEVIQRGQNEPKAVFSYDRPGNDAMSRLAKTPSVPDTFDVKVHGTDSSVDFFHEDYPNQDRRGSIDAYTLSCILKGRSDYKEFVADCQQRGVTPSVRLLSCNTGNTTNTGDCFAQLLANELGHNVTAPTKKLLVSIDGHTTVGRDNSGFMKTFYSRKN